MRIALWVVGILAAWLVVGTATALLLGAMLDECERQEDARRSKDVH